MSRAVHVRPRTRARLLTCAVLSAALAAGTVGLVTEPASAAPVPAAARSAASSTLGARIVAQAARSAGRPYSYGAAGPSSFDCSGFTMYTLARLGVQLPHNAAAQRAAVRWVPNSAKRPGDLIFGYHGSEVGHVGIYAGGSSMWAAVQTGDVVRLQSFAHRRYSVGRIG